ncbi:MAG: V-type ATP synthase subunit A [Firmicutes bacterium]|nr:V-type ATP synthase subunit A [Bacillota bacterium]
MGAEGRIFGINGPVIYVDGAGFRMSEMVMVGKERLIGEVINLSKKRVTVQVYEDTSGLRPDETVEGSGHPMTVTLGPGIIGNIFDGIQRPLTEIRRESGAFISRGVHADSLDGSALWDVKMLAKNGDRVKAGDIIAEIAEPGGIVNKVMIPPDVRGVVKDAAPNGKYKIADTLLVVSDAAARTDTPVAMAQKWPIRVPRPVETKRVVNRPLITGQRIIDTLFPVGKGGMAAIPGGFGTGKTMTQHQLAKWSDADIIIYIGCGERGNEMTEVLEDFSKLTDPRTGKLLMSRTVLIANTSNMPVAAREASIYTGITMAEYFRDMGYHVAIMADSTSRWAEALRELSGRLEEMPAEEGFPAYLASRLSGFYERAGYVDNLNGSEGSITIIGAVSPAGADFSEPVTQNTKRFVRCFWALDRSLAYARHFPAIQWLSSYSEYLDDMAEWYEKNVDPDFMDHRLSILKILYEESDLMEIVKLIGADVLPDSQRLTLEVAKVIRLGFVQQNAYHAFDTYTPFEKQHKMMNIILHLNRACRSLIGLDVPLNAMKAEGIFEYVIALKYNVGNDEIWKMAEYDSAIDGFYEKMKGYHA